MSNSSD
jgi:hypothetical protein